MIILLILSIMLAISACKKEEAQKKEENKPAETTEETTKEEDADNADIVESIDEIDTEDMKDVLPMQIESVVLYKDGSVLVVPTDDLKKNELKDDKKPGLYPFADSGKVKSIKLLKIGNGGYRTIAAVLDDGSVSALNCVALIDDHIIAVADNIGGRDDFVSLEQKEDDDAFGIVGKTKDGEEVDLDASFDLQKEEPQKIPESSSSN